MQTITTPAGETLVVLSLPEYEQLIDQADIARADRIAANLASGREERVPAEVVQALISGENPVRVWRNHRGITARQLAEAAGLSAPYISEIESGKKEGSLSAMKSIAEALMVDLDDLV
ncbi:helix-turn-helix domain-containing protein [Allorhizobium sp. BGMRC 0089]|uniref:helix-turn-helix domain-containing protein n=1 Tax=Allorhizobium sonneratiae TaxID=2934936 RepID=UPI0020336620|nr:helix-turn-helix transcriptional regulator [Allorhizobium sonneratiae]MCM2292758.1 helix-turn-helix domain-containing protein [Allorhizobium sonneratiae]